MPEQRPHIDCLFLGQVAGYIFTDEVHKRKETYDFTPCRSQSLFLLVNEFKAGKTPVVTLNHRDRTYSMKVADITKLSITLEPDTQSDDDQV